VSLSGAESRPKMNLVHFERYRTGSAEAQGWFLSKITKLRLNLSKLDFFSGHAISVTDL